MAIAGWNDDATFIHPLKLASRNARQLDDLIGVERDQHCLLERRFGGAALPNILTTKCFKHLRCKVWGVKVIILMRRKGAKVFGRSYTVRVPGIPPLSWL